MSTKNLHQLLVTLVLGLALTGCGSQTFDVVQSEAQSEAPGSTLSPAKVDIVLAVDDSGSTAEIRAQLNASLQGFLTGLQSQNWDYRVTEMRLVSGSTSISQIAASKYDPMWGAEWLAPYPGATASTVPSVGSLFRKPNQFSIPNWSPSSGEEKGLANIRDFLSSSAAQNSFLRPDAMLAIIVFSNGQDTSEQGTCVYGTPSNCVLWQFPSTVSASLISSIRNVKGAALAPSVKLYSVVSPGNYSSGCLGAGAYAGTRYTNAASQLGGRDFNLCYGNFSATLSEMATHLQSQQLSFVRDHVFLAQQPNPASIRVFKTVNGIKSEIPANMWEYRGYVSNQPVTIGYVGSSGQIVSMQADYRSGYAIKLFGSAVLVGNQTATIEYLPAGVQPSQN